MHAKYSVDTIEKFVFPALRFSFGVEMYKENSTIVFKTFSNCHIQRILNYIKQCLNCDVKFHFSFIFQV